MDVKYKESKWEEATDSIGDFIGKGHYGKGIFTELEDLDKLLKKIRHSIETYDEDGCISFHYTSQKATMNQLQDDYEVLHGFTKKVGTIVDRPSTTIFIAISMPF